MLSNNKWFDKLVTAKILYEHRRDSQEANDDYKRIRKTLKNEFDIMKM